MRALITGVTGQDGSYLAEHLARQGHEVYGLVRGQHNPKRAWIESLVPSMTVVEGDLLDQSSLQRALTIAGPDVVFNLGALTFVGMSWDQPTLMTEVTGLGVLRLLEAIRAVDPGIRLVQASSSEQFGSAPPPQSEDTPCRPRSPYGIAKLFAHHAVVNYRESWDLHASTAIMFNHESPRRGAEFVVQKVARTVAAIARGEASELRLGNLGARRDWGWAPEYMEAFARIGQHTAPGDYVLATGEAHSVRELVDAAFAHVGIEPAQHLVDDISLYRPADVEHLLGDATRARDVLGWEPTVRFAEIVRRMVEAA